jgi:dihydroorotate dehydrogenase (fumarate)
VAVKLSPFYSSLPHLAGRLVQAGAQGFVLFNRFYEPDIHLEELALEPRLELSSPGELLLRLRWLAALSDRVPASLAVSGGVHDGRDVLKAVMAGAHAVQLVSVLLKEGPAVLRRIQHMQRCPDPTYYHRGNYLRILRAYRPLTSK